MRQWTPCRRREFIRRLRQLGFDGSFSGTRHQFMVYEQHRPNGLMGKLNNNPNCIQLDRIAFYGRTLSEYLKMFDIDISQWKGCKALDCPAGASSFVTEAKEHGIHATGCDPLFGENIRVLSDRGRADIEHVIERVSVVPYLYNWDFYPSLDALKESRTMALQLFEADYPIGIIENRYIKAKLPKLPFEDQQFHLVLCGHFLFTYSDKFNYSFHTNSILELFRVCSKEVRIYPIQGPDAKPYKYIEELLYELKKRDIAVDILHIPFEFQKGSNQMMRLIR